MTGHGYDAPCRTCTERAPYCHGSCAGYIEWAELHRAAKQKALDAIAVGEDIYLHKLEHKIIRRHER